MRKTFKNGRSNGDSFVKLTRFMLNHPSWKFLSPQAVSIYIELRKRFNGSNNGEISLSCREAGNVAHCGKSRAKVYFDELVHLGFIKMNNKGYRGNKLATTWILTNESYNNQHPTNEWQKIKPVNQNSNGSSLADTNSP